MRAPPTPLPELNDLLAALVDGQRRVLGEGLIGTYLQGSFAAGDWDASSDVDWVAAIAEPLTDAQVEALQALAVRLFAWPTPWAQHLEGSYITVDALRDLGDRPLQHWYLDNGSVRLERSDHDNTRVVRWTLEHHGIALHGPSAATLVAPVPDAALREEVHAVFRDWAADLTRERISTRWYQPFVVLSYCRMLHTLSEGGVFSKRAGADWGREHLDPRWHGLISRAWAEREDIWPKVFLAADPEEVRATLAFVEYATALADRLMGQSAAT